MRRLHLLLLATAALAAPACAQAPAVDGSIAALSEALSEPGGYFDTDNLISNEASYLHVMGGLDDLRVRGGAYLGVGPDQNFSYIARVRPEIAFIIDIRRDNLLQHLLFKAIFSLSERREDYLGLLLSRAPPEALDPAVPIEAILAHFDSTSFDPDRLATGAAAVRRQVEGFGFKLSAEDLRTMERFHSAFGRAGLALRFQSFGRAPQYYYPTLRDLILERDREGRQASYLASDSAFQVVRDLQLQDRIVPVVGDLAGDGAMPAIARHLHERGVPLTAFYTSNVEFYLAGDGTLDDCLDNLARFPRAPNAVIIRSVFRTPLPQTVPGYASTQLLQRIEPLLQSPVRSYGELLNEF